MAGGGIVIESHGKQYAGHLTWFVLIACIVAASGGVIFGYDIGISGGVTGMDDFLIKFFPVVYTRKQSAHEDDYCKFDNHILQFFTSSLYLAALLASFVASITSRKYGRIVSIRIGAISFLCGALLNGFAINIAMLIIGRILLGVGVGFANQSVPLYLSEMAPAHLRGSLNMMFQLAITLGILVAGLINYRTSTLSDGWKWSLGLAGVPAFLMLLGSFFLTDTPNSLIERGHLQHGKNVLCKTRGVGLREVDEEFEDILAASLQAKNVDNPFKTILERRNRPQLVITLLIPFFQQLTGINAIMFYAPVLFQTIGFGSKSSLYSTVISAVVNFLATLVSIVAVDKIGRRKLFLQGGIQMIMSQVTVGAILAYLFGGSKQLSNGAAIGVIAVICTYVAAFAWSWGPLGWLVPSEIFPMETRSAGQAINVSVNMLFTFVIAQAFVSMLCHFQYGIFLFFAGWVLIMTIFIYFFLPETSGVPIDDMEHIWKSHWFWKNIVSSESVRATRQVPTPTIVVE